MRWTLPKSWQLRLEATEMKKYRILVEFVVEGDNEDHAAGILWKLGGLRHMTAADHINKCTIVDVLDPDRP